MPVSIAIPTALRASVDGQAQVEVNADTVGQALDALTTTHAGLAGSA